MALNHEQEVQLAADIAALDAREVARKAALVSTYPTKVEEFRNIKDMQQSGTITARTAELAKNGLRIEMAALPNDPSITVGRMVLGVTGDVDLHDRITTMVAPLADNVGQPVVIREQKFDAKFTLDEAGIVGPLNGYYTSGPWNSNNEVVIPRSGALTVQLENPHALTGPRAPYAFASRGDTGEFHAGLLYVNGTDLAAGSNPTMRFSEFIVGDEARAALPAGITLDK